MNSTKSEIDSRERGATGLAHLSQGSSEVKLSRAEERMPPSKSSNPDKTINQQPSYQTRLVPGINTEKHPYEAGDEKED